MAYERLIESPWFIVLLVIVLIIFFIVIYDIFTKEKIGQIICGWIAGKFETLLMGWKPFTTVCKLVVPF